MERSLTVVLPVHNAQSTLHATVQEILDVLPELTRRFDVLIVDDGSTDATSEVAQELANQYPQVRVVYRSSAGGRDEAIQAALAQSRSDVVFVRDEDAGTPATGIHKLWEQTARPGTAVVHGPQNPVGQGARFLATRRQPGYRLLQRSASGPTRPNYLGRKRVSDR